jgi:hypothetical protein
MKEENDEEKAILLEIIRKKNLILETEYKYKLFDEDINRVIYILKK